MTKLSDALDILANLDSPWADAAENRKAIIAAGIAQHGVDVTQMYCLHTGKPIGQIFDSELEEAIYEEGDQDIESIADALVIRCVASMRPSPALNKPDHGTIREMAARRPIDALAYLLNRLYGSKQLLTNRGEQWFAPLIARIETHRLLCDSYHAPNATVYAAVTHWLLELDSKLNLHEITAPLFEKDRLGKWLVTKTGKPFVQVIHEPDALAAFESWVFERLHEWDKRDSAALAQLRWSNGNRMTTSAYVRSYLDNPEIANRKHAEELKRKQKAANAAPKKPVSEKTRKNNERLNSFLALMDDVIDGKLPAAPVTPKKSRVILGGMLFAKKES